MFLCTAFYVGPIPCRTRTRGTHGLDMWQVNQVAVVQRTYYEVEATVAACLRGCPGKHSKSPYLFTAFFFP